MGRKFRDMERPSLRFEESERQVDHLIIFEKDANLTPVKAPTKPA